MKVKIKNITAWEIQTISQALTIKVMRSDNKGTQNEKLNVSLLLAVITEIISVLKSKYASMIINQEKKSNLKLSLAQSIVVFYEFSGNINLSQVVKQIEQQVFISSNRIIEKP